MLSWVESIPLEADFDFVKEATETQASDQQVHKHMFTCHKGINGNTGCRLDLKRGSCNCTYPIQLLISIRDEANDDIIIQECLEENSTEVEEVNNNDEEENVNQEDRYETDYAKLQV